MRSHIAWFALSYALVWTACSSSGSSDPLASATIDGSGGTVTVTSGDLTGTSLLVPAGSLTGEVNISIYSGTGSTIPGQKVLGPAAEFRPDGTVFNPPAVMTLVFDPAEVPAMAQASDLIVQAKASTGGITEITPTTVDLVMGTATLDVTDFTTYWVTAPDTFVTLEYFPLNNGDSYDYQSSAGPISLTVVHTTNEPNLSGPPIIKLFIHAQTLFFGSYLNTDMAGALFDLGDFASPNFQEILDVPALLMDAVEAVGDTNSSFFTYIGYVPYGGMVPAYTGTGDVVTDIVKRTSVATFLGTFNDVVEVSFTTTWQDNSPSAGTSVIRVWLAKDVGPVQLQVGNLEPAILVSGIVDGESISAN